MNWKLEILWILSLCGLVASLAIGEVGNGGFRLVLGFVGSEGVVAYVALKAIASKAPRFVGRKRSFVVIFVLLSLGVTIASAGGFYSILMESNAFAVNLEIIGTVIFVSAVAGFVLTLAMGSPGKTI